jgi:Ala-tRNA(Pro) deacylase
MIATTWVRNMLQERGVPFQELHHDDAYTSQRVAQREHVSGHRVAKTVIAIVDGQPVELVLPASRCVLTERVREILKAHDVRLATEAEIERHFPDCEPGATPPLRHWKNVEVLMDEAMKVEGEILFQAGTHTDAVRLRFDDWFKIVKPRVAHFSTPGEPHAEADAGLCARPAELRQFLDELLALLHQQAKEIERLSTHVERHTDRLLQPSEMSLVVSELSALNSRLRS